MQRRLSFAERSPIIDEQSRRLSDLLDDVEDIVALVGMDGRVLYANCAGADLLARLSGHAARSIVGKRLSELGMPMPFETDSSELRAKLERCGSFTSETVQDGRWRENKVTAIRSKGGDIVAFAVVSRDIHERKQAEEKLAEALAFRDRIMSILGHDLRNPLGAIAALSKISMRRDDVPAGVRTRLEQMNLAAVRSLAMIETLLDFSESRFKGTLRITPVRVNLLDIARGVVEEWSAAHAGRSIDVATSGEGWLEVDPVRITQLLSNLIGNALIHGASDSTIRVRVETGEEEAVIGVHNCGPIIPADQILALFEPFRHGTPATAGRPRGLGLGLFIVRQIVSSHGGTVAVESNAAAGTTFTVRLPRKSSAG